MSKQTVLDQRIIVDDLECERDRVVGALGAADYMLGNRSTWSEFLFEDEDANYDGLCRIIGAVKVPHKIKVGSLEDMKSYLLNQERMLSEQLWLEKEKLLRLYDKDRDRMLRHIQRQYDDAHQRHKEADPHSLAWHRLQSIMETYKHLMFMANEPLS